MKDTTSSLNNLIIRYQIDGNKAPMQPSIREGHQLLCLHTPGFEFSYLTAWKIYLVVCGTSWKANKLDEGGSLDKYIVECSPE